MRPATRLLLAFSILMLTCIGLLLWMLARNIQRGWPEKQVERCENLGLRVRQYHEKHGNYPAALHQLVDGGMVTEKEYENLKFQTGPWSERIEWSYHPPGETHGIALFSGAPVFPHRGSSGMYVFGTAAGGAQAIGEEKLEWFMKRTGVEWTPR
jgi:hypothetical protein